jgi:peptidoglycan/xylan/chitin deacetylase (PgdA/CDA1 family)
MTRTANARPIPILVYHQIAPAPPQGTPFRSLCVAPQAFARQMRSLKLLGYQGLSMSALMPYLRGQRQGRVVGITFDDGFLNNLTHAAPVLQRLGFSSTCYAVSGLLGQSNTWDAQAGVAAAPLMTPEQLCQWQAAGQEVGAHSRHHVHLPELDGNHAWLEISLCKKELEAQLGCGVEHYCYPYGEYTPEHVAMVQRAGYHSATTTRRGRCHAGASMAELPRVPVLRTTALPVLWAKIASAYEDRRGG